MSEENDKVLSNSQEMRKLSLSQERFKTDAQLELERQGRKIKPINSGDWFRLNGIVFYRQPDIDPGLDYPNGNAFTVGMEGDLMWGKTGDVLALSHEYGPDKAGGFFLNRGYLTYIDDEGNINLGVATRENKKVLSEAGYIEIPRVGGNDNGAPPFDLGSPDNNELPRDPALRQAFSDLKRRGVEAIVKENEEEKNKIPPIRLN